jgi:tetratricopeptide (TPR) repeat protein
MAKNISGIISAIILGTMLLSGCSLEKKPLNGPIAGSFPASYEEAQAGLFAAYKALTNISDQGSIKKLGFPMQWMDCMSDIGTYRINGPVPLQAMTSTTTTDSDFAEDVYKYVYKVAGRVHLVLDNLDNIRDQISDDDYYAMKAELLCIRAYVYDLGCQFFGAIPFIDHSLTLTDNAYPRTPRAEVTAKILADLDDALLDHLPIRWSASEYGTARVGRAMAYALKARIANNWGLYEEAARCSKKAISLSQGVYGLEALDCTYYESAAAGEPSAKNLFGKTGESSKEVMWALQYNRLISSNVQWCSYYNGNRTVNGCAWLGPSQAMMDTFECTDGKSIVDSPLYDWQNPWRNRDPRLDLYCLRSGTRILGNAYSIDIRDEKVFNYTTNAYITNSDITGNKSEYGPNGTKGPGGYLWRKYADPVNLGFIRNEPDDECNVSIMRYAELLLIEAEANIEWDGGDLALAKKDIDLVRARVNMPEVASTTREGLRTALRYERKAELCDEGFRWFDLRRWKIAEKAVNGPMYAPGFSVASNPTNYISTAKPSFDADWVVTYDQNNTWDGKAFNLRVFQNMVFNEGKDYLFPIPYSEMVSNPAIGEQNPGY